MSKKKFNPEDWKDPGPAASAAPKTEQAERPARPAAANPSYSATLDDQIERLTARIEATGTDITAGYDHWRDLGFALTDALGENGRSYYHRLSRFYSGYSEQECDAQYDKCMRARGHGITIRTLFHLAKENGVSVSFPAEKPQQNFPSADGNDGTDGMMEIAAPESMPTFSRGLYGHLPGLLDEVARNARSDEDADVLILGALVTWSACLGKVYGVYDNKKVYPNLFLYVTAPASAGKGRLSLCRRLAQPIHDQLRQLYRDDMDEYRVQKARFDQAKKKNPDLEPPKEPPLRMLIIPANSSSTSVYQILSDNGGGGLMFETEGDTLANVFASDYGNYSDGFRKAFHHEPISYTRRKDREFVELLRPRLSAVLSGTPRQISALIPDAENGLFSRFIFYYLNFRLEWIDVFARTSNNTLEEIFDDIGYGSNTPGKCSPDRRYHEWSYTRQIAAAIVRQLKYSGYDADLLVPEDYDVSLRARVERVNTWCRQLGKKNVCLVSIHTNAAGNGRQWMNARGWCCYTSRGQTAGDRLATCLYEAAALHLPGHKLRKDYSDGDPDWESDFYILKNTLCASALSENLFHDNPQDLAFLESAPGRQAIIDLHVKGIINYVHSSSR